MIRRVTYVVFWSLLLTSLWLGVTAPDAEAQPKRAQRCTTNWCIIDLPDDPPSTYVMNNQWNNAGAQGSQTITVLGSHSWSTSWDWKRSEEWTVTTYPSAITGWHWGWHFPASHTGLPVAVTP